MTAYPRPLTPIDGPFDPVKIAGAAEGMGTYRQATRRLVAEGLVQPDLICGMTLALIARQPRRPRPDSDGSERPRASGVAGGVWVRERFTIHQPIRVDEPWTVEGEITGAFVRKGRSYSTTASRSFTAAKERFATNLTTGLVSYRPDPDKPDVEEGLSLDETPTPQPDSDAATANPHLDEIRTLTPGEEFGGVEVPMTLAMMAARDTDNPDNPIHSDPEEARRVGLARPIAGGSHVLAFALEAVMSEVGERALLYGTSFDVRWKAPTEDDTVIVPTARVVEAEPDRVVLDLRVELSGGPIVMVGQATIPRPA